MPVCGEVRVTISAQNELVVQLVRNVYEQLQCLRVLEIASNSFCKLPVAHSWLVGATRGPMNHKTNVLTVTPND